MDVCFLRASPARVCKIATKKVQISTLATHFLKNTPTDSLFYYLFYLNIIFQSFFIVLFSFSLSSVSFSISILQPKLQQSSGAHPWTSGLWSSRASEKLSQSSTDPYPLLHSAKAIRHPRNFNTKNPITYPNVANEHTRKSNFKLQFTPIRWLPNENEEGWNPHQNPLKFSAKTGHTHENFRQSWIQVRISLAWFSPVLFVILVLSHSSSLLNQRNGFGSEGQRCGRERWVRERGEREIKKINKKDLLCEQWIGRSAYSLFIF
jgi:hypothetical protein